MVNYLTFLDISNDGDTDYVSGNFEREYIFKDKYWKLISILAKGTTQMEALTLYLFY